MRAEPERFKGKRVGLVLCSGNIDPRILASIMVREFGANILEVDHRRLFLDVPAKGAKLDVTIEMRDGAHAEDVMATLSRDGYQPVRIEAGAAME